MLPVVGERDFFLYFTSVSFFNVYRDKRVAFFSLDAMHILIG